MWATYRRPVAFLIAAAWSAAPSGGGRAEDVPRPKWNPETVAGDQKEADDVQLAAEMPKRVAAGMPVPLWVEVANNRREEVWFGHNRSSRWPVTVEVETRDGKPVPLTRYGGTESKEPRVGSFQRYTVQPGKSRSDIGVKNLALVYDLTLPGQYRARVSRPVRVGREDDPRRIELKTGYLWFEILDP